MTCPLCGSLVALSLHSTKAAPLNIIIYISDVGHPLRTIQTTAATGDDIFKLKLSLFAPEANLNLPGAPKDWKIGEVVKRTLEVCWLIFIFKYGVKLC